MITEDYVSFEIAKLLKEKEFDVPCMGRYSVRSKEFHLDCTRLCNNGGLFECATPTIQMAMKWLREKYEILIEIAIYSIAKPVLYRWNAYKKGRLVSDEEEPKHAEYIVKKDSSNLVIYYYKYEDACKVAIKYCLENLV